MKIPNMIYGTAWKKENTTNLVFEALKQGFKAIDTACQPKHYREDLVGLGLQKAYEIGIKREDLFLQTKFTPIDGQDQSNMPYLANDEIEIQVEKSFETSKKNLHTDFINAYILHSPVFPGTKLQRVWQKMEEFYDKKEVGQLGISNCYDLDVLKYLYNNAKVKYEKSVAEIFYRFLNHINITPLNGTTSIKHMIEELKIAEFELTNDEIGEMSKFII